MKRIVIHHFDKNAHAMLRFGEDIEIIGVYDEREEYSFKDPGELIGFRKTTLKISNDFEQIIEGVDADMVVTCGEGLYFTKPKNVLDWTKNVIISLQRGLDVYSMSKIFYGNSTRFFKDVARMYGAKFMEASEPEGYLKYMPFAEEAKEEGMEIPVVTFVGTSMNSGKITSLLTAKQLLDLKVGFVGTEPSSIFVGADEQVVPEVMPTMRGAQAVLGAVKKVEKEKKPDLILVSSQTGLLASVKDIKEARAGAIVAWQILLGSEPNRIVLCTKAKNVPELKRHISLLKMVTKAKIVSIVINGKGISKAEKIRKLVKKTEEMTGIHTLDVFATPERIPEFLELLKGEHS